jgi:hypothetical protein
MLAVAAAAVGMVLVLGTVLTDMEATGGGGLMRRRRKGGGGGGGGFLWKGTSVARKNATAMALRMRQFDHDGDDDGDDDDDSAAAMRRRLARDANEFVVRATPALCPRRFLDTAQYGVFAAQSKRCSHKRSLPPASMKTVGLLRALLLRL